MDLTTNWSGFKTDRRGVRDSRHRSFHLEEKQRNGGVARGEHGGESLLLLFRGASLKCVSMLMGMIQWSGKNWW